MNVLHLQIRTPVGLVVDQEVRRLVAEDRDGWFGVLPGRTDLVAVLPAGLILFEDGEGEGFVAVDEGLLDLRQGRCLVLTQVAHVSRDIDAIADEVEARVRLRRRRSALQRTMLAELAMEARRRLVSGRSR